MYLNRAIIIGNLTRDPELKAIASGVKVCTFGVATNRYYKDKDGNKKDQVEFHNISVFARLAEVCAQYLKKGRQVLVEGRLQTRSWDGQDGQKRYRTEIIADNVQFGTISSGASSPSNVSSAPPSNGSNAGKSEEQPAPPSEKIEYPSEEINPEDIPF